MVIYPDAEHTRKPIGAEFVKATVNERRTEAAAVSGSMHMLCAPFRVVVDRPFFLAIRDRLSGLLLFTGSVVEP